MKTHFRKIHSPLHERIMYEKSNSKTLCWNAMIFNDRIGEKTFKTLFKFFYEVNLQAQNYLKGTKHDSFYLILICYSVFLC